MGSTSTFAVALLEFLTVGIAAHSAVRQHRLLPCSFKSIWSHVSSAVLGADGHLRRRSPGMDLEKKIAQRCMWDGPGLGIALQGESQLGRGVLRICH